MRRCFYSFHYKPDNWRVAQVRNIGAIEGNIAATDNDWESISSKGDAAIKNWITNQMKGRSCTIVLIGADTANRKWINHEIIESWNGKMGVVGIHIHGLLDSDGKTAPKGKNPSISSLTATIRKSFYPSSSVTPQAVMTAKNVMNG